MTELPKDQVDQATVVSTTVAEEGDRVERPINMPDVAEEGERRSTAICGCSNHGFVGDTCAQCGSTF